MLDDVALPRANRENLLGMAKTAELSKNYVEATQYYNRVLEVDPTVWEAWIGKGRAAGWQSTLAAPRVDEMIVAFGNAVGSAEPEEQASVAQLAASVAADVINEIYGMAHRHHRDHGTVASARATYLTVSENLLDALQTAGAWHPAFRPILDLEVRIARDLLDLGVAEPWKTRMRTQMDRANADIEAQDPNYRRPELAARTMIQREKDKADSDALGYVVAFVIAIIGAIAAAVARAG